jgi:hypothetical protein
MAGTGRHEVRPHDARPRPHPPLARDGSRWHWFLLVPIALPLLVPFYNRLDPRLFGLPFFYWCQLAFAGLSTVVVTIVHVATKRR